uniref:Calponin-homology (CH) domain-containing protein n=1 Tax=Rhabditophanes sp. KR3021 TaxID=114890 RepID=A0AC35UGK1_9BILA
MAAGWNKFANESSCPELVSDGSHTSMSHGIKTNRNVRLGWLQGKRDSQMEEEVIKWIELVLKVFAPAENEIHDWLRDGTILCRLLSTIKPGCLLRKVSTRQSQFSSSQNILNFLETCESTLGLKSNQLFTLPDLQDEKDLGKVFRCLNVLKEMFTA